jgi:hypothetical protein
MEVKEMQGQSGDAVDIRRSALSINAFLLRYGGNGDAGSARGFSGHQKVCSINQFLSA